VKFVNLKLIRGEVGWPTDGNSAGDLKIIMGEVGCLQMVTLMPTPN
jgi:hypothetical protein